MFRRRQYEYENDDGLPDPRCALCGSYDNVAYCSLCGLWFCDGCKANYPDRVTWMMKYYIWKKKLPYG